jgi:molybdopterin-guanine dinucleotide biosynthesis protein A
MDTLPVYILAGGKSSRFGHDKARVEIGGEPLLVRVVRSYKPVAASIAVVADRLGKYRDLGIETIADLQPNLGPMGGLQAALSHHGRDGWLLCASCDRIGIRPEWLQALLRGRRAGAQAVIFHGDIWQPLPALYHASILKKVNAAVRAKKLTPWVLFEQVQTVALKLPDAWENSRDINDMETLTRLTGNGG